ncbi:spore-associated protein A [Nocardiopsis sp. NPDC101807]|uniref:spore-associated protein A n=1 Tax=Nocardiopsis sp. NPDC101807 TaxID=3364339 RepID=UPI0037FB08AF
MSRPLARRAAAALGLALAATALTAPPASAAYGGQCGSGYTEVNQTSIAGGTVHLTYNNANGRNCVVVERSDPGSPMNMDAALKRSDSSSWQTDPGNFTQYAGPVYLDAAGQCVDWGGVIGGEWVVRTGTNCG